jgi:hypothetical protein
MGNDAQLSHEIFTALKWKVIQGDEHIEVAPIEILRAPIVGGWLILTTDGSGLIFVPDPEHRWNGGSLTETD